MGDVISHGAVVRPRVVLRPEEGPRLLEDVVAELADELPSGLVWLVGGPGSGKTTAIAHLATLFAHDDRLAFLDEPTHDQIDSLCESKLLFAARPSPRGRNGILLRLLKWSSDDLVEYLLATHPADCKSVMTRFGAAARKSWTPELACAVVKRMTADAGIPDPQTALTVEVESRLANPMQHAAAEEHCFARATDDYGSTLSADYVLSHVGCPPDVISLMRHEEVQYPLAAAALMTTLVTRKSLRKLLRPLPIRLVELVGAQCRNNERAIKRLRGILNSPISTTIHPMAASILAIADAHWCPQGDKDHPCLFTAGMFRGVNWPRAGLAHANLGKADLTQANLVGTNLVEADATSAIFADTDLRGGQLSGIRASQADFRRANLSAAKLLISELAHVSFAGADLSNAVLVKADMSSSDLSEACFKSADLCGARLSGANFDNVDFTDAKLDGAQLAHADLRTATLHGTCLESAVLSHAQLEDVLVHRAQWKDVRLEYAQLTGSRLPSVDLRDAKLPFAQLAEIDWPNADLRCADLHGASFHMGSSRSGLVGSPIACEGSKTGFYTDEREEMYFKRPEEIRKANLRGADLRGARIENVDFYLVDLRDARLDSHQRSQARQTGAILDDWDIC